jgi:DNA replication protein DnaC
MADSGICGRCEKTFYLQLEGDPEPWCTRCIQEYAGEYRPIYASWFEAKVRGNPEQYLAPMGVPRKYRSCSLESFEADTRERRNALRSTREWIASDLPGLFLCGPCGTGKTHLATGSLLEIRASNPKRWSGRFVSASELLFKLRNSFDRDGPEDIIEEYCKASILVLDDLGAERSTPFSRETLAMVVDQVYRQESILIITGNFDINALAERIDKRTADRLVEICRAFKFKLSGTSYRQKRALERANLRNLPVSEHVQ